ncbi:peptide ABC transporter substrate-binding protein [Caldalkalibacillus salinus]|uniref:peptide ABC transporter substrate-binding protein n=1 Tax=Caldalkalibacillus salinus TaxID=2803787 RepID=UPI0019203E9C|nr:peptide ABC transporter substrate-binding protein [Caldalkalibacillus salinus]
METLRKYGLFVLALTLVFALAACTTTEGGTTPEPDDDQGSGDEVDASGEKVLVLNNVTEPTSLDPPQGFDSYSYHVLNNLMEGLTRLGPDHDPQEATAESWDVSEDGRTYTFHIREDAKWSNGEPVTAHDFEYAWKRLADPETASPAGFLTYLIEGAEAYNTGEGSADDMQVTALDDQQLEVTLTSPQSYFLSVISNPAFFPVHKDTVKADENWANSADTFVSNGPFHISDWDHNNELRMVRSDHYWDADTVKLEEVVWQMVDDPNTAYQLYQTGDLHVVGDTLGIPADMSEQLFEAGEVDTFDRSGVYFYRFNLEMEPFHNENIRKAFALAVDSEAIVEHVTKQGEKPAKGFVAYGFNDPAGGDFRDNGGDLIKYDPEQAKALLEQGMEEEGYDTLPEITLAYNTSDSHRRIAEVLKEMYSEHLGVDVTLTNQEWNVFLEAQRNLELQFSRSSFLADFADPINYLESFITGSSMNRTGWSNAEYDDLIAQAKQEADDVRRYDLMHQAEELLFDEMPLFPIYFYNQAVLQADGVSGIVSHPVGYMELKWADVQ